MAAEYSAIADQEVLPNSGAVFTETGVPCNCGLVYHKDGSSLFRVANKFFRQNVNSCWRRNTHYNVTFHANIAVPEGQTVGPISLAIAVDGEVDPSTIMTVTPAAVSEFFNVGADTIINVPYLCGCSSVSVRNVSTIPVTVQSANITFEN